MRDALGIDHLQQKLADYKPSAETVKLIRQTPILLLVGVSGAGKDSIKQQLLKIGSYHRIVSHTTRKPRENKGVIERDGIDYHFIDLAAAERMLDAGEFVEAKMYSGNIYGTSVAEIQRAHDDSKIAVTDIEVQGVAEYKAISSNAHAVFVLPPSYEIWQHRLQSRYEGDVDSADMKKRLRTAKTELTEALRKDYYKFVINDDLEIAATAVDGIAHGGIASPELVAAHQVAQELLDEL